MLLNRSLIQIQLTYVDLMTEYIIVNCITSVYSHISNIHLNVQGWSHVASLVLRTWDALNKANQGGIAIFGAQVVAAAGYRGCFFGSFIILLVRHLS